VKVDDGAVGQRRSVSSGLLAGVDERPGERDAVGDVVRASGPLEAAGVEPRAAAVASGSSLLPRRRRRRWRRPRRDGAVAAAAIQLSGAARSSDGVDHARRRDGVHERRFPCPCQRQIHRGDTTVKLRLHDTTGCQSVCTNGWITGCIV